MTKRSVEETRRFHLFLYQSDLEYLERRFGAGSFSKLGVGTACREIIHNQVKKLRAREHERFTRTVQTRILSEWNLKQEDADVDEHAQE